MRVFLYLTVIVLANILTAKFAPIAFGVFLIPVGTFLIGGTFILRDLVQNKYGRKNTYVFIGLALTLAAISSFLLGDTLWIVFASALSFTASEVLDTEIYTRMKSSMTKRVFFSGAAGGTLDSALFVVIGLSPLGAGFVPWEFIWMAILGQVIVKIAMQGIGALVIKSFTKK